jgi:hypothetical protein
MQGLGRRTFAARLAAPQGGGAFLDYYVKAEIDTSSRTARVTAPLEAPARFYTLSVVV